VDGTRVMVIRDEGNTLRGCDHDERRPPGAFDEIGDPYFKPETDLKQHLRVSDGHEVARLRRIGVFIFIAFQQGCHANIGSSHLFREIFQDRDRDDNVDRLLRSGGH